MINLKIFFLGIYILILAGCASESMEFTTAKTALRSEKDFVRAEEWLKKALKADTTDAMVAYVYATEILKPQKRYKKMASMLDLAEKNDKLMVLSADLGRSSGLDRFKTKFPNQYLSVGISEQNLIGVASGLADEGFKVFVTSFVNGRST